MQKVTTFSKTKFCSSRDIVIISVLHFISKQHKIKLVSFLYLLGGRRLPALEATTFCFLWIWWCVHREGSTVPTTRVSILNWPLKHWPQLGKVDQTEMESSLFMGARMGAQGTLKTA